MERKSSLKKPTKLSPKEPPKSPQYEKPSKVDAKSHLSESKASESDSDLDDGRLKPFHVRVFALLEQIKATNLGFNPVEPGIWDEWGVYYCSSRFGRYTHFNSAYFSLTLMLIIGHCNIIDLIRLTHENGGGAFLIVLFLAYASFGYPMYLIETLMGQYTGRKPILMATLLLPAMSGLGVGLYIRTMIRAICSVGHFVISLNLCWDSLFCRGTNSMFLARLAVDERQNPKFKFFQGLDYAYASLEDTGFVLILFLISLIFGIVLYKLNEVGLVIKVVLRLIFLGMIGFFLAGFFRTVPTLIDGQDVKLAENSIVYLPWHMTFTPNWRKLLDGNAWVKAISFVANSMELGSLAHPYLGSKNFFHYRCMRDGIYLIGLAILWNLCGMMGIVYWLGYVGITTEEIKQSYKELEGHYGLFVVFFMKHVQAEMTQEVEADVIFFMTLFYFLIGVSALVSSVIYLYILIDCSYPESGHPLIKFFIACFYLFIFVFVIYPLMSSPNALRHLVVLDFYGVDSWVALFLLICFAGSVTWSQGVARILYDFFNMMHLKGYEVKTHYHRGPKIFGFLYIGFLIFAMIRQTAAPSMPSEGVTDWTDSVARFYGTILLLSPALAVLLGFIIFLFRRKKGMPILEPHRDFYKNKHHTSVCFKDYQNFYPDKTEEQKSQKRRSKFQ